MVKHHTVARRYNPIRSKRRRSRRRKSSQSENTRTDQTEDRCFTITLRDVGDIDDKELNLIPSSIQGETSSWAGEPEDKRNDNSFAHNPLLQIESAGFCHLCTMRMLDIHEHDDGTGSVCDHEENVDGRRRNHVAQSILKVFQSITEGRFTNERVVNDVQHKMNAEQGQGITQSRLMTKKCRTLSKAMNTSNREMAKCSLSRLSIQVMCTSESTQSTALTHDPNSVVLWPPQEKLNPESVVTKKKLEAVAGALLMELCKVTAKKIDQKTLPTSQKKILLAKDSYMPRLKKARHGQLTTGYSELDTRLSDWMRELCHQKDSTVPKRGILKKARSQIEKSKINIFRPLLCTKLSIPWLLPKSVPQIACKKQNELEMLTRKSSSVAKPSENQNHLRSNKDRTRESKKENSSVPARRESKCSDTVGTKVLHAFDTRNRYRSSDSVVPFEGTPAAIDVPLRLFASKTIGDVKYAKKKRAEQREDRDSVGDKTTSHRCSYSHQDCREPDRVTEKRVKEVCPKCKSSIQCSIAFRRNSLRKIKTKAHNILAYPCKKIVKKTKPSSRPEKSRRQQLERSKENGKGRQNWDPTTKYFIKSFFTGTSTSETTKPAVKTVKKVGRRKKIVPPRMPGRAIPHDAKKRRASPKSRSPRRHHGKVDKEDSNSDIELEIQASEEMDIINQHIRAHKTASDSSPVFHTCFKRLLDKELKAQQSSRDSKPSRSRRILKGGYFTGRAVPEVKMFNEGIFSCLIPKVFK